MHFLILYTFGALCLVVLCITGYFFYVSLTSDQDDYNAVTENAEPITIKEFYRTIKKIQGLEGMMHALLHKGQGRDFKKHDQAQMRGFFECAQVCNDLEGFKCLKIRAVAAGISISHAIVVNIMFLMSQYKEKELGAKIHAYEETMTLVNTREFTVVVYRILDKLQEVEIQLKRRKDSEKADMEMAARASKGKNVITEKEVKIHREAEIHCIDDGDLRSTFLDPVLFQLLKLIFKAELLWVYKRLPSMDILLIEELPLLENESTRIVLSMFEVELLIVHSQEGVHMVQYQRT